MFTDDILGRIRGLTDEQRARFHLAVQNVQARMKSEDWSKVDWSKILDALTAKVDERNETQRAFDFWTSIMTEEELADLERRLFKAQAKGCRYLKCAPPGHPYHFIFE